MIDLYLVYPYVMMYSKLKFSSFEKYAQKTDLASCATSSVVHMSPHWWQSQQIAIYVKISQTHPGQIAFFAQICKKTHRYATHVPNWKRTRGKVSAYIHSVRPYPRPLCQQRKQHSAKRRTVQCSTTCIFRGVSHVRATTTNAVEREAECLLWLFGQSCLHF